MAMIGCRCGSMFREDDCPFADCRRRARARMRAIRFEPRGNASARRWVWRHRLRRRKPLNVERWDGDGVVITMLDGASTLVLERREVRRLHRQLGAYLERA